MDGDNGRCLALHDRGNLPPMESAFALPARLPRRPPTAARSSPLRAPRRADQVTAATEAFLTGVGPRSRALYRRELRRFLGRSHASDLLRLTAAEVGRYIADLERDGLAPASRALSLSAVRSWLAALVRAEVLDRNPADGLRVRVREADQRQAVALAWDEVRRLLAPRGGSLVDLRDAALLHLGITLGLRVSELRRLRVGDVRLAATPPTVSVVAAKTGRRQLRLLNGPASRAVRAYLRRRGRVPAEAPLLARHDPAAPADAGISAQVVAAIVARRAAAARVRHRVTPHGMRVTFITLAAAAGVPLPHIQHAVGHTNLRTTGRYIREEERLEDDPAGVLGEKFANSAWAAGDGPRGQKRLTTRP